MRVLVTVLSLCLLAGVAAAQEAQQKAKQDPVGIMRVECEFTSVWMDVNFGEDPSGVEPSICDVTGGGLPVWEWGTDATIPPPPAPYGPHVWGTILNAPYTNDSGEGLLLDSWFTVDVGVNELLELVHFVDIETNYDGCNVVLRQEAGETVLEPMAGYPATISTSTSYYAWCVDNELGFTGHDAVWTTACFDLTPFAGQFVSLRFDFGSDSSVTYPGWFIAGFRLGTDEGSPVEEGSWSTIKALYR